MCVCVCAVRGCCAALLILPDPYMSNPDLCECWGGRGLGLRSAIYRNFTAIVQ